MWKSCGPISARAVRLLCCEEFQEHGRLVLDERVPDLRFFLLDDMGLVYINAKMYYIGRLSRRFAERRRFLSLFKG
jgi:hypothetical protein